MTQDQDNTTTMFETTNVVLAENDTLWEEIPAFAEAVSQVQTGAGAIREKTGEQVPTGEAAAKTLVREDLEEKTVFLMDQVSALASKKGDALLAAQVEFTKSQLDRFADSDLLLAARAVQKGAADNGALLASTYGIPAAVLTEHSAAITKFDGMKTAPRNAAVNRKVVTLALPEAIVFVRGIYRNELDKMMTRFKKTQPDFYAAYFAARVIVDRAATHQTKPAGTVTPVVTPPPAP